MIQKHAFGSWLMKIYYHHYDETGQTLFISNTRKIFIGNHVTLYTVVANSKQDG